MRPIALALLGIAFSPCASLAQEEAAALVAEGEYLVRTSGCHDCHTPFTLGSNGPEPDMTRALSGHPQEIVIEAPAQPSDTDSV
jgi:mono/diheme cytochrome c family protein